MDTDDPRILGTFVMIPKRKAAKLSQSNRSDHPMTSRRVAWWHATWAQFTDLGFREAVTGFVCAGENKSIGSTRTCSTRPVVQPTRDYIELDDESCAPGGFLNLIKR